LGNKIFIRKHLDINTKWLEILLYYDFVESVTNENENVSKNRTIFVHTKAISILEPKTLAAITNKLDSNNEALMFNFPHTLGDIIGYTWNAHVIAYLQTSEVMIGFTSKEHGWVVHKATWFKWEDIFSYGCGWIDKYKLCFAHNNMKALCNMFMKSWTILGFDEPIVCFKHNINGGIQLHVQ
jgi:hypothetical protein